MMDTSACLDRHLQPLLWTQRTKTTDLVPISCTVTKQVRAEALVLDLSATQARIKTLRTPTKLQTASPPQLASTQIQLI